MNSEQGLTIADLLSALWRRRLTLVSVGLPISIVSSVFAFALPSMYRSEAEFRVLTDRIPEFSGRNEDSVDQHVMNLRTRILSREFLVPLIQETDPYPELAGDSVESLRKLRRSVEVTMLTKSFLDSTVGRERLTTTGFILSYENRYPEKAAAVASKLAEALTVESRTSTLDAASAKVSFFSGEADRLNAQIMDLERRLSTFKQRNFELLPETTQANIAIRARYEQELDGVQRELGVLRQNRVFVAQQLRQATAGPSGDSLRDLEQEYARKVAQYSESHPDVVSLRRQIDQLRAAGPSVSENSLEAQLQSQRAALAEARERYSEDHPDLRRLMRNIESLEARIASGETGEATSGQTVLMVQLQTQQSALDTQIASLETRALELRRRLDLSEARLGSAPEVEREYQSLTRGLDTARGQYNEMVARRLDAEVDWAAVSEGSSDRFQLLNPPAVPIVPAGPKRAVIVVISVIVAVFLGLSAVVATEVLDPRVRGSRDVRGVLGMTPMAVIPEIRNSIWVARRRRHLAVIGLATLVGTPALYAAVYLLAR